MANNNNEGADNSPDNLKESGLDKSFVGKFVSGLFNSTPLSKWFGKDSKSTVRRREEDEDDEDFDTSYIVQPPSKRARLPTPAVPADGEPYNFSAHIFESPVTVHNASNNVNNVSLKVFGKFPEPVAGPSGINSRKLFERHNTASTNTVSTNSFENQEVVNGDNDSDSEESTSGYSSAPKLLGQHKSGETPENKETNEKVVPKSKSLFTSITDSGERTLFPERSPNMNTSLSSRRPSFNTSTFGSPSFVDRTLSTKRIMSSPFYSGNTIYGGASAYGRRLGKRTEETNHSRVSVQIKPVNEKPPSENATLSKTARRILNTLEQYSTPISDAKKIPVTPRKPGLLSPYIGATPYLVRGRKGASNKELQVPSVPDLLQMKQKERLQNTTETVRQIATKSKSSLNKEEYKIRTEEDNKQKHSNKMKSSVASVRQKVQPADEPVSEVKLPKVSLPITTLPKFDFVLLPPTSSSSETKVSDEKKGSTTPVSTIIKPTVVTDIKETEKKIENGKTLYTFSKPLVISKELKAVTAINCFKFSEPVCKKQSPHTELMFKSAENKSESKMKNNGENTRGIAKPTSQLVTGSMTDALQKKPASQIWECPRCRVKNDSDKVKCCPCDEPKPQSEKKGFGEQFKMSSDKWECASCMVRNNNTDKSCVACATPKPGEQKEKPVVKFGFGDSFKPSASTWECSSCLIRNKDELEKCAACGVAKTTKQSVVGNFGDKFKASSDTWECSTCMIRNKNDSEKCAACETPKPGAKPANQKTMTTGLTFSFGVKPEWECKTCLIKNKNELVKCAACEMPREGETEKKGFGTTFKTKGGEWECSSCLVRNKSTVDVCVCCGVSKSGNSSDKLLEISKTEEKKPVISFNFGIDKSSATQFKFGIPTTTSETKESTNTITPPTFSFGDAAKTTSVTSTSFSFGINTQEKVAPTKSVTSSESLTVASNPLLKPNEKLPEKATPAPAGFKFGLDSNKTQETVVSSSSNKTETSTAALDSGGGFGVKAAPMFQFKPPAINGDINKLGNDSNKSMFGGNLNKPNDTTMFSTETKPTDSPFGNKTQSSPFGSKTQSSPFGAAKEPPFGSTSKPVDSSLGSSNKLADLPLGSASNKPSNSPFGNPNKPTDSLFGGPSEASKPKPTIFGGPVEPNKPPSGLFGNVSDTNKPQETLFGGDANKPKEVLFGSKPTDSTNMFSNPNPAPTFSFTPKPMENASTNLLSSTSSQPPAAGIFKFGAADATQGQPPIKRAFAGPTDNNVSNGFGSPPKIPAFGASQDFGSTENKPFAFGSTDSAPRTFSFGQTADKPNAATAPVFSFGSTAAAPSTGFNFSAPSTGFNFGAAPAAKVESQPFNTAAGVFGAAGASTAKNGSFNFGTNANNNNQKAVFSFGANQTSQPSQPNFPNQGQSQPNFPNQGQSQPGFNFGAPTPSLGVPGAGFNFTGASPSFNFTDGSSGTAQPQRKIRKALRRTTHR